jgi:hypothetical protein
MADNERDDISSGWFEWSKYVLKALEQHDLELRCIETRMRKMELEQSVIKTKFATYVGIGAGLLVLVVELARFFFLQ